MTDANEKKGSSSRLDRLLALLASGSTSRARAQAAEQIGELVLQSCKTSSSSNTAGEGSKVHVHAGMLPTVLRKVRECSRAKEWETRVAAGKAMGAIAKNLRRRESPLYPEDEKSNNFIPNDAFCASARDVCKMELIEYELVLEKVAGERANRAKEQRTSVLDEEVKEARDEVKQILDLKLENFDIESVLNKGIVLLSSTGDEWSNAERGPGTKTERLERAKMNLKKTLGMELGKEAAAFGLDSKAIGEMVTEKDLVGDDDDFESLDKKKKKAASKKRKKGSADEDDIEVKKEEGAAARLVDSLEGNNGNAEDEFDEEKLRAQGMSAREVNKLKRKNKRLRAAGKTVVKHHQNDDFKDDDGEEEDKKKKSATKSGGASAADVNEQQRKHEEMEEKQRQEEDEEEAQEIEAGSWPFTRTCEFLAFSLFSSRWEDRHGAAVALREILRYQAECANIFIETFDTTTTTSANLVKVQPGTAEAQMRANFSWLEDISVRLLCVLALDRFGDFVGDGVVAPVRETAAQALGASLRDLPTRKVFDIGEATLTLLKHEKAWEVRHSGLIGLKYVFASIPQGEQVKMDMLAQKLLPSALPRLILALKDDDDDVRAAAAEAALPARESLNPQLLRMKNENDGSDDDGNLFKVFLETLWNALLELDDLSPSARPIMSLLAKLCEKKETRDMFNVAEVAPRLWPFAAHPIASVREATWQTVSELSGTLLENEAFVDVHLADYMTLALQGCALDEDDNASLAAKKAFLLVLELSGFDVGSSSSSSGSKNVALEAVKNTHKIIRLKVAEIFKVKSDAFLKVLSVQVNRTCDAHYILVKKPAKMTGEARNVAADWLCRTKTRFLGIECVAKALVSLLPTSSSSSSEYAEEEETLTLFLNDKVMALSKHGTAAARGAAFHVCANFLETAAKAASIQNTSFEFIEKKFKPLYETRVFEVLACANPAYPSAPSPFPYDEAKALQTYVKNETKSLLRVCLQSNVAIEGEIPSPDADGFGAANAVQVMETVPKTTNANVERARSALDVSASRLRETEMKLHQSVLAAAASLAVSFQRLPQKLNPIIQPLMASTRRERDEALQSEAAKAIAKLVKRAMSREKSPSGKICSNIFLMACSCPETTPIATESGEMKKTSATTEGVGVQTTKTTKTSSGKKLDENATAAAADVNVNAEIPETAIAARGGAKALREFCREFGDEVFTELPALMTPINESLDLVKNEQEKQNLEASVRQTISNSCRCVSVVAGTCTQSAFDAHLRPLLKKIFAAASSLKCHSVKTTASNALAAMTTAHPDETLPEILALLAPALEGGDLEQHASPTARLGAAFVALSVTESVPDSVIAPYCVLLLVPLMSRMSDSNVEVRTAATKAFAALVPLLPLARGSVAPEKLSKEQKKRSSDDGAFLEALLDNTKIANFELPFKCKYQLRPYQRDGVNWLAFLRRFKLHGALCDDMGLGKTLQSTCILASSTCERRAKGLPTMPHLIICPPTLVGHWAHEISMYTEDPNLLSVCEYQGSPQEREKLQNDARTKFDVVVASYDSVRADAEKFFHVVDWCYCVLDEGHAIRNPKSRVCVAVKQVKAEHRLLLSGTPIQNDVVELWSLFDFLMPGFLGTEREFKENYGIAAARSKAAKKGGGLTEQGALTVGRLHKQVMPFVLRRTKDQVLKDLPPKIIQDVFVDLTAAQRRLYDTFETSGAKEDVSKALSSGAGGADNSGGNGGSVHVFQALQYLRKLCSHPRLVDGSLNEKSSAKSVAKRIADGSDNDMNWSPKFEALKQILLDCGIGRDAFNDDEEGGGGGGADDAAANKGNHRVLVFAQLKSLLDLVEDELFQSHMKDVSWLRLDGSVPAHERFNVARKFNADPTIDVLLLTTHVGGLGLNLTTADTVVFLEHDWNPQKDLQAMDRAHRLGQKKTVNVYRILTRGTIEEKVMSLQRFKLDVANAVVNADNASMKSMDTGAMLELFTAEKGKKAKLEAEKKEQQQGKGEGGGEQQQFQQQSAPMKQILNGLDELWAQSQYDEEFDVEQFQKTFSSGKK